MKFFFDLIPVFVFFGAYSLGGLSPDATAALTATLLGELGLGTDFPAKQAPILLATLCAIIATIGQVAWLLLRGKKVDKMLWVSLAIIVVMGGLTLAFRDPTFIQWKPTILYWAFGIALLVSQFVLKRNLIESMTQGQIELPAHLWSRLSLAWVAFFAFMGVLNLYVAFNFSEPTWVKFKLFGSTGLMVVFMVAQGFVLWRYIEPEEKK
jgi:intracellular septation protein